ncbi:MAG: ABC transporter substrate-binding protein, partial [Anaerolineae bacterium]
MVASARNWAWNEVGGYPGVFKSTDGGLTWTPVFTADGVWKVIASPDPAAKDTLFALTNGDGIQKSLDGGVTWASLTPPDSKLTGLALSPNFAADQTVFVLAEKDWPANGRVYSSTDGGLTWNGVDALRSDPRYPAVSPNFASDRTVCHGGGWNDRIYCSTDGGATWTQTDTGLAGGVDDGGSAPDFVTYPELFIISHAGMAHSGDGGASWSLLRGLRNLGNLRGVAINNGAANNTIGPDNLISNNHSGVEVWDSGSDGNVITGNIVGPDATGLATSQPNSGDGINLSAGHFTRVENNLVSGAVRGEGIRLGGSDVLSCTVRGNTVGADINGANALPNEYGGVVMHSGASYNTVEGNLISGNNGKGIGMWDSGTYSNTIRGNRIGTNAAGTAALPNGSGIDIDHGVRYTTIGGVNATPGGACSGDCNLISGNGSSGVSLSYPGTMSNTVSGNYIGVDVNGTAALGNYGDAVRLDNGTQNNLIGGSTPAERNLISGNGGAGVIFDGSGTMSNTVRGNYIGTNAAGTAAVGNSGIGVEPLYGASDNLIEYNLISGNDWIGAGVWGPGSDNNVLRYNIIGADASGQNPLPNGSHGVSIGNGAQRNVVGPGNTIAYNQGHGVQVSGWNNTDAFSNTISQNSIHSNAGRGIELAGGGNRGITAPVILTVTQNSAQGMSFPGAIIELFSDDFDEGRYFHGVVAADAAGNFSFAQANPFTGTFVSATATDSGGNTSEFGGTAKLIIGATVPLSPPGSVGGGQAMKTALEIAVDEINANGGLLGMSLQLDIRDTAGTPALGAAAMDYFNQIGAAGVVGEYHSAVGITMTEKARQHHLPVVFAETWNDTITAVGYDEVFRIAPASSMVSNLPADYVAELGFNNVVIIADDSGFGVAAAADLASRLSGKGIASQTFSATVGTTDFSAVISAMQVLTPTPQAVLNLLAGNDALNFTQQAAQAGLAPSADTISLIVNWFDSNAFWQNAPDGNYTVFRQIGPLPTTHYNDRTRTFVTEYISRTGKSGAEMYAMEAYDSLMIMADAIERAGSTNPDAIIKALEATDLTGAQGHYTFPFGANNPVPGSLPAYMWHQWPDPYVMMSQYFKRNQSLEDAAVVYPAHYQTHGVNLIPYGNAPANLQPDTLNLQPRDDPLTVDPAKAYNATSFNVIEQLFIGLVDVDDTTGDIKPELAKSWRISADRTVYTFTLRSDAKWTDGAPITAGDVRYGILRSLNPDTGSTYGAFLLPIIKNGGDYNTGVITDPNQVGVTVLDNAHLQITLENPAAHALSVLAMWMARPVPQATIERWGNAWTDPAHIVTSGAYRLSQWVPDNYVILDKSPAYFDAANVEIERVKLWLFGDDTAWQWYQNGELDTARIPVPDPTNAAPPEEVHVVSAGGTYYLGFNAGLPPFDDPLVRQAFSLATNRGGIVASMASRDIPALTFTPPGVFGHVDGYAEGVGLAYNPPLARQKLAQAGHMSGTLLPPITLWYNTSPGHQAIAKAVREHWFNTLGVSVTLQSTDWQDYLTRLGNGEFQVWRLGWVGDYPDAHNFMYDAIISSHSGRFGGWSNAAYTSLLSQAAASPLPGVRKALYRQAEQILVETDAVVIPIYYYSDVIATRPTLERTYPAVGGYDISAWRFVSGKDNPVPIAPGQTITDTVVISTTMNWYTVPVTRPGSILTVTLTPQ